MVTPETSALGILFVITLWLFITQTIIGWVENSVPKEE